MSRLFIPDPDPAFLPIGDPGVKKAPDPGSGTLNLRLSSAKLSHFSDIWRDDGE
jgi:hypothetical protein